MNIDSATQASRLEQSYPALPDSIPAARAAIVGLAARAGATDDQVNAVRLAASEALTNAVLHAYDGAPGLVHVCVDADAESLALSVADDGAGIRPRIDGFGMGLGLALIAESTQELAILKRPGGGVELQMRFALSRRR